MRITLSVKLNLKNDRHRQIVEALQASTSVSSAIVEALEAFYFPPDENDQVVAVDNAEVLRRLDDLQRQIASIKYTKPIQQPDEEINPALRSSEVLSVKDDHDLELSDSFLVALQRSARPGMRMDD